MDTAAADTGKPRITIIVPTFNEAPNIYALVTRTAAATAHLNARLLFVDDSTDHTRKVIKAVQSLNLMQVRILERAVAAGGLSGAVIEGLVASDTDWCVVMDGDLQHPPELIPVLCETGRETNSDLVLASWHLKGASSGGLSNWKRQVASRLSNTVARSMFPVRLRNCSDPMTGFFAVRRDAVDVSRLRPRGFKIMLEILARFPMKVAEEPFVFAERNAGKSKASLRHGFQFIEQLASLRFGRLSAFAVIGALGAVANLATMAALQSVGVWYIAAAIVSATMTILGNFVLQERFVFHDLRHEGRNVWGDLRGRSVSTALRPRRVRSRCG